MSDSDPTLFDETPTRPTSFRDFVYNQLKTAIITGRLRPGERVLENRISAMLNVSRTPLREAIGILEREGYFERIPTGGVRVSKLVLKELLQLNQVRIALERLTAQLAARRMAEGPPSPEDKRSLAELDAAMDRYDTDIARGEPLSILESGHRVHQLIHRLSHNDVCAGLLDQVMGTMERYRALATVERSKVIARQHREIVEAIRSGDEERAVDLMTSHLEEAGEIYARSIMELQVDARE